MPAAEELARDVDYPVDRKFGRASNQIRPLSFIQVAGCVVAAAVALLLVACGALIAICLAPLEV